MSLPSKAELETSIKGAFQLLLQKPEGLRLLDASERGYWRSFYAMAYALPFHFFVLIAAPESLQQMVTDRALSYGDVARASSP